MFTKCYKEATDEQRAGLTLDAAFLAEVEQLKRAYNGEVHTVWGGNLLRRFCKMFSESFTVRWAVLQLPCCPSKQGNFQKTCYEPSKQVAAPPSTGLDDCLNMLLALP